jgi:hypothetical protein
MIDEPGVRGQVENAWRQVLGEPVSIRCVLQGAVGQAGKGGEKRENAGSDVLLEDAKRRGAVVKQLD